MTTSANVAAYLCGVRLRQAQTLANPEACFNPRRQPLRAALIRLRRSVVELSKELPADDGCRTSLIDRIARCEDVAEHLTGGCYDIDLQEDGPHYSHCCGELDLEYKELSLLAASASQVMKDWLELGNELANGEWDQASRLELSKKVSPISASPQRRRFTAARISIKRIAGRKPKWAVANATRVDSLIEKVQVPLSQLMDSNVKSVPSMDPFEDIPVFLSAGWTQIEVGINRLLSVILDSADAQLLEPCLPATPHLMTPLQASIVTALEGRRLTKDKLAEACGINSGQLYKPGGINELKARGLVKNQRGVGYYLVSAPPAELIFPEDTKAHPSGD